MTITNVFLNEVAKAINNESYAYPTHEAVSTATITPDITDTSLTGEIGTRISLTGTRSNNQLQLEGLRVVTDVIDTTNGDALTAIAVLSASSGGSLLTIQAPIALLHTTTFEIEFINNLIVDRP